MLGFRNTMRTWFLGIACASSVNTLFVGVANAQVTPDGTLPNNSDVKVEGNINKIEGGTTAGTNLFHSFKEFSVKTGSEAHFNNAVDISNIITRVTGKSISDIDGLIKANGSANLFLINPNGIVFGENARLDIGGSFVGSTADAIGFGEDDFFSASNPESSSSLLNVNPNALFFNQMKAASIENNSIADAGLNASGAFPVRGLRVPDDKSLLLVGGDININGGGLLALGGRVELGGLEGKGTLGLNGDGNNLSLSFPDGVDRSDVSLSNGATVAVIADDGGSIAINARNLEMTGGSSLFAGIESGLGSDESKAGNIDVNATDAINLNNQNLINNGVLSGASGQGGDINISASTLQIEGGAQASTVTFGEAKGGNLTVEAQDVQLIRGEAGTTGLFARAERNSTGDAGDLTIKTGHLLVQDGARISASTFGTGKGGNLTVSALESIQVIGESADNEVSSGLVTQTEQEATGNAGDLTIKTGQLLVRDGAQVSASTLGTGKGGNLTVSASESIQVIGESADDEVSSGLFTQAEPGSNGNAGDLTIKTGQLLVGDGAQVGAGTFGTGKGGNLTVSTSESIQVIGRSADGFPSGLFASSEPKASGDAGDLTIQTRELLLDGYGATVRTSTFGTGKGGSLTITVGNLLVRNGAQVSAATVGVGKGGNLTVNAAESIQVIGKFSGLFTQADPNSIGDAGDLKINTDILQVEKGAAVSVQNLGTGRAGNLIIDANSIRLNNDALLTADTRSNKVDPEREQATININSQDLIMRRGSNITTDAQGENVIGGNININTDILVALENSDISANSRDDRGGNVRIESQGIFGTQFRPELTPKSDITATGVNQDSSGNVEIITPDTDTNSGLVNLPTIPVETEVAQACAAGSPLAQSRFEITALNGLPPNPSEALTADAVLVDLVTLKPEVNKRSTATVSTELNTSKPKKIVEATGFSTNKKGEIFLVADGSNGTHHSEWNKNTGCRSLN